MYGDMTERYNVGGTRGEGWGGGTYDCHADKLPVVMGVRGKMWPGHQSQVKWCTVRPAVRPAVHAVCVISWHGPHTHMNRVRAVCYTASHGSAVIYRRRRRRTRTDLFVPEGCFP